MCLSRSIAIEASVTSGGQCDPAYRKTSKASLSLFSLSFAAKSPGYLKVAGLDGHIPGLTGSTYLQTSGEARLPTGLWWTATSSYPTHLLPNLTPVFSVFRPTSTASFSTSSAFPKQSHQFRSRASLRRLLQPKDQSRFEEQLLYSDRSFTRSRSCRQQHSHNNINALLFSFRAP